ncbi:MAG TPA: DNA-deoxyinosine glycosylase [Methanomassiliicoccales archaeon]|nr:DNA-deoxyinosine glycosylase [Methanomassiliicoccales archaeon]
MSTVDDAGRTHRYGLPPIVGEGPKVLILGTVPSVKSALKGQYYGNPRNHFWRLMAETLKANMPEDYAGRCVDLTENGITLWDVLAECEIRGSGDHTITDPVPNDIPAFLRANGSVRHIFINGMTAFKLYRRFQQSHVAIGSTVLPSSSPANAIDWDVRLEKWMAIRKVL